MGVAIVRSIKPKAVFGNPKGAIARAVKAEEITVNKDGLPDDGQRVVLGYIYGVAAERFLHQRNTPQPDGSVKVEKWPALRGEFEATPADPKADGARSPMLFLPEHITDTIGNLITGAGEGARINMAFEVLAEVSSKSSAGFIWVYNPKTDLVPAEDPLSKMKALAYQGASTATISGTSTTSGEIDGAGLTEQPGVDDATTDPVDNGTSATDAKVPDAGKAAPAKAAAKK